MARNYCTQVIADQTRRLIIADNSNHCVQLVSAGGRVPPTPANRGGWLLAPPASVSVWRRRAADWWPQEWGGLEDRQTRTVRVLLLVGYHTVGMLRQCNSASHWSWASLETHLTTSSEPIDQSTNQLSTATIFLLFLWLYAAECPCNRDFLFFIQFQKQCLKINDSAR